jgi:hypothetical protein
MAVKTYHMIVKYTACSLNIPHGRKHFPLQGTPKHTQVGFFGMQIYHLATLVNSTFLAYLSEFTVWHQHYKKSLNAEQAVIFDLCNDDSDLSIF